MADSTIEKLEEALYARLNDDATLSALATGGVHNRRAPQGTSHPIVIFRKRPSGRPIETLGDPRACRVTQYDVYGIVEGNGTTTAARIDERIEELLADHKLSVTPYKTLYCRRRTDIELPIVDSGVEYDARGGMYEIWIG